MTKLSLMFVGKAESPLLWGVPESCPTQVGSGCARKHQIRLERLVGNKYCKLQQWFGKIRQTIKVEMSMV